MRKAVLILAFSFICCILCPETSAQIRHTYGGPSANIHSFDGGIRQLRYNAVPDFSSPYDDYLQYAPAIAMVGMKVSGYDSRTQWGRMLVSDAFSAATEVQTIPSLRDILPPPLW